MIKFTILAGVLLARLVVGEDSRIIGGETSPTHYPYQISLQIRNSGSRGGIFGFGQKPSGNWSHNCGGSVYNENYIVTAAHCISGYAVSNLSVLAGTKNLNDEKSGSRHLISDCKIHPDYVELNNSDIAVCRMKTPFIMGNNIQPIALETEYVGVENCILTGWGYTMMVRGSPLPNDLQRANLTTLTNEDCNSRGSNVGPREICTFTRVGQGACGGDSGGPLACKGHLVGIVSYGTIVCAVGQPDVYTRASSFVSWVNENTGGSSSSSTESPASSTEQPVATTTAA